MSNTIFVKTEFEGLHYYPEAKFPTEYLKNTHRHIFHVYLEIYVKDLNREIEFITLKNRLTTFCKQEFYGPHTLSCEMMCERIVIWAGNYKLDVHEISVSEDGENGAKYHKPIVDSDNVVPQ